MSVQETKLKAIADAIREKDGTAEPIPAADFPDRIRAISVRPNYLRSISIFQTGAGSVYGTGLATDNMNVTVKAEATDEEYYFVKWQNMLNGKFLSTSVDYTFMVDGEDVDLEAVFSAKPYWDWRAADIPDNTGPLFGVAYGNNIFVAVGYNEILTSTDGKKWTSVQSPTGSWPDFYCVTFGGGMFVAGAYCAISYSTNGIDWVTVELQSTNITRSIAYGNGKFVAVGDGSLAYSTDGKNWTELDMFNDGIITDFHAVTYGSGKFVAVSPYKTAYSTDGIRWTASTGGESLDNWIAVTYGSSKFVAVGPGCASYSTDGARWYSVPFDFYSALNIAYGNGKFVVLDPYELIYSSNGTSWLKAFFAGIQYTHSLRCSYVKDMFFATSESGTILYNATNTPVI